MVNTIFLGFQIDNHLSWKNNVVQMTPKWNMLYSQINDLYQ